MTSQLYQLVVRKGPRPGQIFPLELDLVTVGRDPLSDIVIEDPEVSRHHASFTQGDEGYLLQDRGSTNGSFVGGERLGGDPVQLNPGQVIMFGSTVTLVYQATPMSDPLATMVAPIPASEAIEPEPPVIVEEPEPEIVPAPPPVFEEVEPVPELPDLEPEPELEFEEPAEEIVEEITTEPVVPEEPEEVVEVEAIVLPESQPFLEEDDDAMATMVEDGPIIPDSMPAEQEALPAFDEPDQTPAPEVELPSEPPPLAPLPSFDEPVPEVQAEPVFEAPSFDYSMEAEGAVVDSGAPIPDYDAQFAGSPPIQTTGEIVDDEAPNNRNRNIIIGVVALLLLCCLCLIVSGAVYSLFLV